MGARLVVHVHIPSRNLKAALLKPVCLSLELTGRWRKQIEAWHPCPPRLVYCGGGEGIQASARQASDLPLTTYLVPWCFEAGFKVTILLPLPPSTQITGLGHHALQL